MKQMMKKMTSLALILVMVLGMTVTSFAATLISEDKVKEIAYEDAGIQSGDVKHVDALTWYRSGGGYIYKFVFRTSTTKYVYKINAVSGSVVSKHTADLHNSGSNSGKENNKGKDKNKDKNAVNSVVLTSDEAMAIAMKHTGLSASSIKKQEIDLDRDDGRYIYEIELETYKGWEYELEIDAETGDILDCEIDK